MLRHPAMGHDKLDVGTMLCIYTNKYQESIQVNATMLKESWGLWWID
jgi:hypothetical protein